MFLLLRLRAEYFQGVLAYGSLLLEVVSIIRISFRNTERAEYGRYYGTTRVLSEKPHTRTQGLWNLNVYCNQRHFAFEARLCFVILMFLPHLYEMFEVSRRKTDISFNFLLSTGWEARAYVIRFLGILLGSLSFFMVRLLSDLLVLFVIALFACRRLEFVITAVITTILSMLQTSYFIDGTAVSPKLYLALSQRTKRYLSGILFGAASGYSDTCNYNCLYIW